MEAYDVYKDIAGRTGGDIYLGVVGPVRTGKSTFIKKLMDEIVLPNMTDENERERATDELPQSGAGKTIMTTQPSFVPGEAVRVTLGQNAECRIRMVDCVGYMVAGAVGTEEDGVPRMVRTPWSSEDMPFEKAAEIGTKKVIVEHATIGIVMTTDGTIADIPREDYVPAEERVVAELRRIGKPFVKVLNSADPASEATRQLAEQLREKYKTPV